MKKIILLTLLLTLSAATFSKQTNPSPTLTKQDYLQKSKKQKTAEWVLLSGGVAIITTAFVIPHGEETS